MCFPRCSFESLRGIKLCSGNNAFGINIGLANDAGGLFFGDAEHCFETSAKTGIGGSFCLAAGCLQSSQAFSGNLELFESALAVLGGLD